MARFHCRVLGGGIQGCIRGNQRFVVSFHSFDLVGVSHQFDIDLGLLWLGPGRGPRQFGLD